jgi:hypothetical protein
MFDHFLIAYQAIQLKQTHENKTPETLGSGFAPSVITNPLGMLHLDSGRTEERRC